MKPINLFTYGSLMYPQVMYKFSKNKYDNKKGILYGYLRKNKVESIYPGIRKQYNAQVKGVIWFDIKAQDLNRLDQYQGWQYKREQVIIKCDDDHQYISEVYVISNEKLLSQNDWNQEEYCKKHIKNFEKDVQNQKNIHTVEKYQ